MDRSYIAIRREQGKPDVRTHFPEDPAARAYAVEWCRSDGYKVISDEQTKIPNDDKFAGTIIVTVEPKPKPQMCPTCHKLGIVEVVDGKTYYTHKQTVTLGSGTANFGFQSCPVPPSAPKMIGRVSPSQYRILRRYQEGRPGGCPGRNVKDVSQAATGEKNYRRSFTASLSCAPAQI